MPIYEYHCTACDREFSRTESLTAHERAKVACPNCHSTKVERMFTPFTPRPGASPRCSRDFDRRIEQFLAEHTAPADARASAGHAAAGVDRGQGFPFPDEGRNHRDRAGACRSSASSWKTPNAGVDWRPRLPTRKPPTWPPVSRPGTGNGRLVLERKLVVQREELVLAERDVTEWTAQLRAAKQGLGAGGASAGAAWRDIESAGGTRPETDSVGTCSAPTWTAPAMRPPRKNSWLSSSASLAKLKK